MTFGTLAHPNVGVDKAAADHSTHIINLYIRHQLAAKVSTS